MTDPKNMVVGQWGKTEGDKQNCEKCGKEVDVIFKLDNKDTKKEEKVCEGCYKNYWLERGYIV